MKLHMLTTIDNPFSPITQYDEWYRWDYDAGYHTPGYLARIIVTSDELSETDQDLAIEAAIDEICKENITGLYRKLEVPGSSEDVAENSTESSASV